MKNKLCRLIQFQTNNEIKRLSQTWLSKTKPVKREKADCGRPTRVQWGKPNHPRAQGSWWYKLGIVCKVPQPLTGILQRWTVASAAQLVRAHPLYLSLDFHHTANKQIMSFWEPAITSTSLLTLTGSTPSVHDQTNAKSRNSKDPPGFFGEASVWQGARWEHLSKSQKVIDYYLITLDWSTLVTTHHCTCKKTLLMYWEKLPCWNKTVAAVCATKQLKQLLLAFVPSA